MQTTKPTSTGYQTENLASCENAEAKNVPWLNLPLLPLLRILDELSFSDLLQARLVCVHWCEATHTPEILRKIRLCINDKNIKKIKSSRVARKERLLSYSNYRITSIYDMGDIAQLITCFGARMRHLFLENSAMFPNNVSGELRVLEELVLQQIIIHHTDTTITTPIDCMNFTKLKSLEILNAGFIEENFIEYLINADKGNALRHLSIFLNESHEEAVLDVLESHASKLSYLEICILQKPLNADRWRRIIDKFRNLETLKISWKNTSCDPVEFFSHLPEENPLKFLNMSYFMDGRKAFKIAMKKWSSSLEVIEAEFLWWLNKNCMQALSTVRRLRSITLVECDNVRDESLLRIFGSDVNYYMKELVINQMRICNPFTICCLAKILPNLRKLSLISCHFAVNNESLYCITANLHNLEDLVLDGCFYISDDGMLPLKNLTKLHTLSLRYCNHLTDLAMDFIKLPNLRELNISYCDKITGLGLKALPNNCPHLEILSATSCKGLRQRDIMHFIGLMKRLRLLVMYHCPKITSEFRHYIHGRYPNCRLLISGSEMNY